MNIRGKEVLIDDSIFFPELFLAPFGPDRQTEDFQDARDWSDGIRGLEGLTLREKRIFIHDFGNHIAMSLRPLRELYLRRNNTNHFVRSILPRNGPT